MLARLGQTMFFLGEGLELFLFPRGERRLGETG